MARERFGQCRGCGRRILWINTAGGKKMPVDPEMQTYKIQKGGTQKIVTPNGEVHSAEIVHPGSSDATGVGYISHFATCPQAKSFRKR